ncbi:ABC-type glutathione transport system ATPase component [Microbacterium sp. SORGH_AS 1204]|nr:ABC-type glutathione transport system ATPase component [Microbacterium sp. SORGH_AS_1204]
MTSSTTDPAAIDARGVVKGFGSVHAVRGVDLTIRPGEIVAFLGPNGAGKTPEPLAQGDSPLTERRRTCSRQRATAVRSPISRGRSTSPRGR